MRKWTRKKHTVGKKKLYQADHVISSLFARLPTNNLIHASVHLTLLLYLPPGLFLPYATWCVLWIESFTRFFSHPHPLPLFLPHFVKTFFYARVWRSLLELDEKRRMLLIVNLLPSRAFGHVLSFILAWARSYVCEQTVNLVQTVWRLHVSR